ncbi:glycosyltransferase 87 family protein [Pseudarthrobacter sp. NamE5]|uniref:glycosyltransferase 87 family protein n=1 Tax=Pseudarthrobacter sp. NamE5 TaxID=2576839 RepID=UPI00110AB108|nr:glycosyltransferase 87 family protein [Pseudarthrobacter sp. NamE5]TLM85828.1 DUF2029 domain-containing protein [Pseudarthrobacter sp. NamE5]
MKRFVLWDLPRVAFPLVVSVYLLNQAMHDGLDLRVYWAGAREFIGGGDLYAEGLPGTPFGGMSFTYPPFAAALMAPLALLPVELALVFQTLLNLIFAGAVGLLIARYLHSKSVFSVDSGRSRIWLTAAAVTGLVLLLGPWRNSLALGQINPLLLVLIAVDLLGSSRRRPDGLLPRGILTGIAAGIKLTPLVFLLYFVVRGDIKSALRMGATFAGTVALMAVLAPVLSAQYWLASLGQTNRVGDLSRFENVSIRGLIARLEVEPAVGTLLWVAASVAVVALGALAVFVSRRDTDQWGAVAATAIVMLLVSPVSWGHHWVWVAIMIPAVMGRFAESAPACFVWWRLLCSPAGVLSLLLLACFALQPLEAAQASGSPSPYSSISPLSEMFVQSGLFAAILVLGWLAVSYSGSARRGQLVAK